MKKLVTKYLKTGAEFPNDRIHRYALYRIWDESKPLIMFIGLNPSTADEKKDDPTIKRCVAFAKHWGYGGLIMANIFAYRATDPRKMKKAADPVGPDNDKWIRKLAKKADKVVGVWGNHGTHQNRGADVVEMFPRLFCIAKNKSGTPAHPLYKKMTNGPMPFDR
jgi:hypothetical protein